MDVLFEIKFDEGRTFHFVVQLILCPMHLFRSFRRRSIIISFAHDQDLTEDIG